ncbi:flagellar biosynthetic protein FliO [Clostridium sp.]|uniref:flagellar biosynthetic protein FliO n=1 Tax=Clostridium sp. TaxID=1506 RepID=UPI001A5A19F6|nr:flagellar biosynthetic protein FliO [Clostridium sp.]MBK5240414.1 flagellar biosynthetic protein FliO [Clostridium sp.]
MIEFWTLIFKIIIFLPFILVLMYLSLKYGSTKLQKLQDGKYMKILDRVALSKENSIVVVKIGGKAYAISSSSREIRILFELPPEEVTSIESSKDIPQLEDVKNLFKKHIIKKDVKNENKK